MSHLPFPSSLFLGHLIYKKPCLLVALEKFIGRFPSEAYIPHCRASQISYMKHGITSQIALPSSLLGAAGVSDPKVKALYDELEVVTKKIQTNDLGIPPENQRSPSPEPVYDRNGIRLNTREVRAKERLMERRSEIIEGLIKSDPAYRPPPDYRWALLLPIGTALHRLAKLLLYANT